MNVQPGPIEIPDRDLIAGLEKGLAVIEAFDETRPRLSVSDVARITGLTRAAARRYLLTLTKLDYAAFDGKFFSLMPRILRLGHAYLSSTGLPAMVQPYLEQISAATQESCSSAILDDTEIVYIARAATRRIMSIGLAVGTRLPAYCTSLGRILLADLTTEALDRYFSHVELKALTPKTKATRAEIVAALEDARTKGYSLVDEELELGLRSMSVPVYDKRGVMVAAINVSAQAGRASVDAMVSNMLPHLKAAQDALRRVA
ncbi:MAG TPA: IclR family transcriptional regulator C-terminal domain-containing protein [Magnetospirillaceae bacterium]|jgi:IclR family pca regulon transcriptional regulator